MQSYIGCYGLLPMHTHWFRSRAFASTYWPWQPSQSVIEIEYYLSMGALGPIEQINPASSITDCLRLIRNMLKSTWELQTPMATDSTANRQISTTLTKLYSSLYFIVSFRHLYTFMFVYLHDETSPDGTWVNNIIILQILSTVNCHAM